MSKYAKTQTKPAMIGPDLKKVKWISKKWRTLLSLLGLCLPSPPTLLTIPKWSLLPAVSCKPVGPPQCCSAAVLNAHSDQLKWTLSWTCIGHPLCIHLAPAKIILKLLCWCSRAHHILKWCFDFGGQWKEMASIWHGYDPSIFARPQGRDTACAKSFSCRKYPPWMLQCFIIIPSSSAPLF